MSIPNDEVSTSAHNAFLLYTRYVNEIPTPTVPKHWIVELLFQLNAVLDENDELHGLLDPPPGGYDEDPDQFEEVEDWGVDSPPEDEIEADY